MYQGQRIGALLLMGGTGERFGDSLPKQFHLLGDKRVYLHTLEMFRKTAVFDEILLVCHPDWINLVREEVPDLRVVAGGATRQESSFIGLQNFSPPPEIVVIHDAVRPFVTEEILRNNIEAAIQHGAADTCIPSTDTLVHAPRGHQIKAIPLREEYLRGQTPQTFRYSCILAAHCAAQKSGTTQATDDCKLVLQQGLSVFIVPGSECNMKITTAWDLQIAKFLHERNALHH